MERRTSILVGTEALFYLLFLTLDLMNTGAVWSKSLKYASILLCFVWVWSRARSFDGRLVGTALGFTLLADLFLLVLDRWYLAGLWAFCVVQGLYFIRILLLRRRGMRASLLLRGLLALAAAGGLAALRILEPLTAAAALYFSQLAANALESLTLGRQYARFTLGLFLFVCCDLCVGLHNLSSFLPAAGQGWLFGFARVGMWLFYLPSQVLITLSVRKE